MLVILEIDDALYNKAVELRIDLRTFVELKLYEYITGRESLLSFKPIKYEEIKPEFEKWLKQRVNKETADRYLKHLEGLKEISVESISRLYQSKPTNNMAKAIRNLINFLEEKELIDITTANKFRKIAKIRKTKSDKVVPTNDDIFKAYSYFKSRLKFEDYLIALILLYSGARLSHVVKMLKDFDPKFLVFKDGFARYEIGHLSEGFKEGFWIYMPDWLAKQLKRMDVNKYVKDAINYKAESGRTVSPKYIRKWFNNLLVKLKIDKDIRNFILGRRREIKVSVEADNYLELLEHADKEYKRVLEKFPFKFHLSD